MIHTDPVPVLLRTRWLLVALLAMALTAALVHRAAGSVDFKLGDDLLSDAPVTRVSGQGVPEGWTLSGPVVGARVDPRGGRDGSACLHLRVRDAGAVVLAREVAAKPHEEYLLTLGVRSAGRVVVQANRLFMSYHEQGEWQKVSGLVRTGGDGKVVLSVRMSSLDGKAVDVRIQELSLRPVTRPSDVPVRPRRGATTLVQGGEPQAYIVYPSSVEGGGDLARRIQEAVSQRTGATLPVVSDAEATERDRPVLLPAYRDSHLVLIGRLGTNRAIWPAYNRFLAAVDGYYPGEAGHVVRTAANVLRNGKNHLIVGSSSDAGLERAVTRFTESVASAGAEAGTLTLPWLLDVEMSGEALDAMKARDELWSTAPRDAMLPPVEPGYGTVRRWYENAMGYYWSGWDSYRERAIETLDAVVADRAYTHHYIAEFLVRSYDMVDDADLYTDGQRAAMDRLVLENFTDFMLGSDLGWMTTFSPPYENIQLSNRHQIAPWMADREMAQFLSDYLDLAGELADLVAFRRGEKHRFMEHLVSERWGGSLPPVGYAASVEEIVASLFRFALHHEQYQFFEQEHARKALHLDRINHLTGRFIKPPGEVDHHLVLGILANYYGDGRYRWLLEHLPLNEHPTGPFQSRYVAGIRRYSPGVEVVAAEPLAWGGVRTPPMMPHDQKHLGSLGSGLWRRTQTPPDGAMDLITFRSGMTPADDYVAINGTHGPYPPGIFIDFTSRGQSWFGLGSPGGFSPTTDSYFDHNAVSVVRTDKWLGEEAPYPATAALRWLGSLGDAGGAGFAMEPFMDTRWEREVLWVQPGLYVVRDTVTALEDGAYQVTVNWRPAGSGSWDGRTWTSVTGSKRLRITPLSDAFKVRENVEAYRNGEADQLYFRHVAAASLRRGESVTATAVIQAISSPDDPAYDASLLDGGDLVLAAETAAAPLTVRWGGVTEGPVRTDARVVVASPQRWMLLEGRELSLDGAPLIAAKTPVHVAWDAGAERVRVATGADPATTYELPAGAKPKLSDAHREALDESVFDSGRAGRLAAAMAEPAARTSASGRPAVRDAAMPIVDASDRWRIEWTYTGLQRPGRVTATRRAGTDVVDLGREVRLAEVQPRSLWSGPWQPTPLPDGLWAAAALPNGQAPPPESDLWKPLPAPQWRPGFEGGNYGRAVPTDRSHQVIRLDEPVAARYVRGENAHLWHYFDAASPESREPLRLEIDDVDGDGGPDVLVASDVSRDWPRPVLGEDASLAILNADGTERFQYDVPVNLQSLRLLDQQGNGRKQVFVTTWDAQIRVFEPDGSLARHLNLFEMHETFQATRGRPNTRHPAGGYTTPYDIGLWRPDAGGARKIVVARYGRFSFLDAEGEFEGVLNSVGYAMRALLPEGVDFNGDGVEEQIALERFRLIHLDGSPEPRVEDPTGEAFYPQVYASQPIKQPDSPSGLAGAPVLVFETLPWGADGRPRYVLVIRETFLGIYDALERKWAFNWVPLTSLRGASVGRAGAESLEVHAVTDDGLLWSLTWRDDLSKLADFEARALPIPVSRMRPSGDGGVLLSGLEGLYQLKGDGSLLRLSDERFHDAQALPVASGGQPAVVATTRDGRVVRLDASPGGPGERAVQAERR